MSGSDLKLGFIGAGRAATALALGLQERGYDVAAVASRTPSSAEKLAGRIDGCAPYADPQSVADCLRPGIHHNAGLRNRAGGQTAQMARRRVGRALLRR